MIGGVLVMPMIYTYSMDSILACIQSDGERLPCPNSSSGTLTGAIGSGRIKFSSRPYECVTRKKKLLQQQNRTVTRAVYIPDLDNDIGQEHDNDTHLPIYAYSNTLYTHI